MRTRVQPTGKVIISVRDYERLMVERPSSLAPRFYSEGGRRRIVFQIWDWIDQRRYRVHLYVTRDTPQGWITHHFEGSYRAVTTEEIGDLAQRAGLREIAVLTPQDTGFDPGTIRRGDRRVTYRSPIGRLPLHQHSTSSSRSYRVAV